MKKKLNSDGPQVHQYQLNVFNVNALCLKKRKDRKTMFSCDIRKYSLEIILFQKRKYIFVYNIKYISKQFSVSIKSLYLYYLKIEKLTNIVTSIDGIEIKFSI